MITSDWGRGFSLLTMECAKCGHIWVLFVATGTQGARCPACGDHDRQTYCGSKTQLISDGIWLTGRFVDVTKRKSGPDEVEISISRIDRMREWQRTP